MTEESAFTMGHFGRCTRVVLRVHERVKSGCGLHILGLLRRCGRYVSYGCLALVLVMATLCTGCQEKAGQIPPDKFEEILYDVMRVNGAMGVVDSLAEKVRDGQLDPYAGVLQEHGVTRAQFDTTLHYYCAQPAGLEPIVERLIGRLQKLEDELGPRVDADSLARMQELELETIEGDLADSIE